MEDKRLDWLMITIIAFLAGIVSNIVYPVRRGIMGFIAAGVVGIFSGGVAGISACEYGVQSGTQYLLAGCVGVCADRFLATMFAKFATGGEPVTINTTIYGVQQQNVSQRGGSAAIDRPPPPAI